jgi:hypothetical protein
MYNFVFLRKLEERKEYFQPQVLQIDDTYEEPLTDLENEEDYYDPNHHYNNNNIADYSNLDEQISILSLKDSSRPKSAFKQNFDYEENSNIIEMNDADNNKNVNNSKEEKKKHRSKSRSDKIKKDKKDRPRSRSSKNSKDPDSRSSSRIATGDTGYESISTLSLSSSFSTNLTTNINDIKSVTKLHQPIIVSSNSSASSSNQLVKSNNSINLNDKVPLKPITQQQNSTLKQLKTNLLPLSGIKLPK